MRFTAVINKEEDLYVAWCPDLDIASQGKDIEGALENLKEAIELYLEDKDAEYPKTSPFLTTLEVERCNRICDSMPCKSLICTCQNCPSSPGVKW